MNLNDYQELAARTINRNLNAEEMKNHALHGMVGEIGEIHALYQKLYQGHTVDNEHLKKEVGDLLWFIAEFCTANYMLYGGDWSLENIARMNVEKLKARYPDGFDAEHSLHRKAGDI
ncbi:MazG nucleotide pyrophosphohydrolase domain-containing protein [uncultured Phascolarctobacterium sp.]|uniref:nucleoside triphosphate pyrophosphohydrolase family protein n=1 Tax=uncultured Phascolarctobacterium sp. TaxID=512296 RepID=UPI0027D96131|nr:MazG nucleotide pyrophosphohydrolase domain-containing protein [uncultured Phascolarctobacterium sp.]